MAACRDAPLNNPTRERFSVCGDIHRSSSLRLQPERHTNPWNTDLELRTQPGDEDWEEDDSFSESDEELEDGNLTAEEIKFLNDFPEWKKEQEKFIAMLHAFAEDADKMHRKFTKSKMVTNSVTVVSEFVTIVGFALVPVTAGASLLLSTASKGVSAAAALGTMVTELREKSHNKKLRAQASIQVPVGDRELTDTAEKQSPSAVVAGQALYRCGRALRVIKKGIRALWPFKGQLHSGTAAKHQQITGTVSAPVRRQVQRSTLRKVLKIAKLARMGGRAFASMSLNEGVSALWKNWKQLKDESKAELAEELRAQARELEEVLVQYTECYDALLRKKMAGVPGSPEAPVPRDHGGLYQDYSSRQAQDSRTVPAVKPSSAPTAVPPVLLPPPKLQEALLEELIRKSSLKGVKKT